MPQQTAPVVDVEIVSDVMCPWCIVGYRQLEQALGATGIGARVRWLPFELNPDMPPEGQNLTEHIAEKYGASADQSAKNRAQLQAIGQSLGIDFAFSPNSRIVNSFEAHQLLDHALGKSVQHPLKLALFHTHFTERRDVSDRAVLLDVAETVGLDRKEAEDVLKNGTHASKVREQQAFWTSHRVSGVPSMVFAGKYLVTGAQGVDTYGRILQQVVQEDAA